MASDARTKDFLRTIVDEDLAAGRHAHVATRFPPEPNGYLHIGHAKAICVDFGIAADYRGTCNLRFDDTNPTKEEVEYVESIERDVRWLGFEPAQVLFASDYFEEMYQLAERLVDKGLAYVCDLDDEQIRSYRGTLTEPGRPSPWRERAAADNLALLRRMRAGEFPDGARVLRAKIDMAAANMKMRDPLLYRIRHAHHHRTGDAWCIYPMYDYAHPLEDAFEGISHSFCTLEFENNRELYDWVIEATEARPLPRLVEGRPVADGPPRQYEFARLALDYTMMSKRRLLRLVDDRLVDGWDDPRMPTLAGMRRRGFTPEAIRSFCDMIGVAKTNSVVDVGKLEYAVRDDLNRRAPRLMGVVRPLPVTLTNVTAPADLDAPLYPAEMERDGTRSLPFDARLFIDRDDFALEPPPGYHRLAPGRVVRLRYAGCIRCDQVEHGPDGEVIGLRCSVVEGTMDGDNPPGDKVWGVIHWVSAARGVPCEVRLYDRLFAVPRPDAAGDVDLRTLLYPQSLEVVSGAVVEPHAVALPAGTRFQLERVGYFVADEKDATADRPVFNRVVSLRDSWAQREAEAGKEADQAAAVARSSRAKTRPARKSAPEQRAIARQRDPVLAGRLTRYPQLGLSDDEADLLSGERDTSDLFDAAAAAAPQRVAAVARWIINELPRVLGDRPVGESALTPAALIALVGLVEDDVITAAAGKELLGELVDQGGDPAALVEARGLRQVSSANALAPVVAEVIAAHPDKVDQYRGGRTGLLGFFVGQVMKASGGKANPATVNQLVSRALAGE